MADVELSYRVEDGGATQATAMLAQSLEKLQQAQQEQAAQARLHAQSMQQAAAAMLEEQRAAEMAAAKLERLDQVLQRQKMGGKLASKDWAGAWRVLQQAVTLAGE
ncbi:MAG: hypothetical protein EBR33_12715 [Synechococcaceae bacterium WB4_1_0192]|nr:hypothetical protein [Synechococcaceae bacterium WB4_1_0192]